MRKIFSLITALCLTFPLYAQDIIVPGVPVVSVAEAVEIGMALGNNASTDSEYAVEGYVINAGSFSLMHRNQCWYMADDANAESSNFQAYNCYPIDNGDTIKVLNGDKVSVTGKIKKYVKNETVIIEIERGDASFIEKTAGDHTVYTMVGGVTVGRALEIGAELENNGVTVNQYAIRGYISAIDVPFSVEHKNQSFWVTESANSTAASNADGAFYVYRGKPETGEALPVGTKVEFVTTIKKYVPAGGGDPVIENADQNIMIYVLTEGPQDNADVVFTSTDFYGQGTQATEDTPGSAVSATKEGVTFSCNNAYGDQYAVRCYATGLVSITSTTEQIGKLVFEFVSANNKYYTGGLENEIVVNDMEWSQTLVSQARMSTVKVFFGEFENPEGIESVTLTDQAQKILHDGQLYIIRDGMLFTVQGTRIR